MKEQGKPWGGPRKGAGRKALLDPAQRLTTLGVCVRPAEREILEAACLDASLHMSSYLRLKLGLPAVPPPP